MLKVGALALILLLAAGCQRPIGSVDKPVLGADLEAGREAIVTYGCGSCHVIPGVQEANAYVGPPLNKFEQRHYIAGNLPNNADNLVYWIQFPQSVEPGTAMPNLNVTETDARNIAAYLYSQ
ncbi:MAG: c-type cytochrome [Chloroflexi bacterium]|nr:c-type cytochrome [Chloroflexota bacterium]MCC6896490.1 c-type cytochrome [Anaerolineae bacterium]